MSVVIEEELLDERMLEGEVPCQMLVSGKVCGLPSIARTRQHCTSCKGSVTVFVCGRCLRALRRGAVSCYACKGGYGTVVLDAEL